MKSILHDKKEGNCFLCMMLWGDDSCKVTEEHHIFFGDGRRKMSEKYGMKVQLCIPHHRTSKEAVHQNIKMSRMLQEYAQREFEKKWPEKDFYGIFGRNYVEKEDMSEESGTEYVKSESVAGFRKIEDGIEGMDW